MKSKIFTLLGLAALAVPVLASCGGNNGKQVKPGVYFFAEASSIEFDYDTKKVSYKKERYRDTECAIVEVENGDNLKYGEQDVVVTIEPEKLFTFKEWDYEVDADKQTWKQRGKASRPYVGLGSPTNLYSYELAENVAWTFEDLSETKDSGYQVEKYKITVKKEFFKRNIVIAYGVTDGHPVFVHTSEHYKTNIKVKDANGADLTDPMWKQFFSKPDSSDSAFGPGDGMMFTFNANSDSGNNLGDNALIGFDGSWEDIVLDEKNPDPDDPTIYTYANFDVYGIGKDNDGKPIEELLSKVDKTENNYFHFTRTGGPDYDDDSSSSATFYVPWPKIIGEEYSVLYDEIQLRLKKMPVLTDVSVVESKSTNVAYVESGYFNLTKDSTDYYNRFYSNHFGFTYKDSYYTVNADGKNKVKGGMPEFINEKQTGGIPLSYGALIIVENKKLNSVDLTFSGSEEAKDISVISVSGTAPTKTTWRSKAFNIGGEQKDYELEYWLVNDWYLVKLTTSDVTSEFFGIEGIKIKIGDSDVAADIFYLYPNPKPKYGRDPFAYTRETGEKAEPADKLEIIIKAAK